MRKMSLAITWMMIIIILSGCQQVEHQKDSSIVTFQMIPSQDGVEEFLELPMDYKPESESDICYNITPEEISEHYGFRIFKFTSCASFLQYEGEAFQLGMWFGGSGATSFAVVDLNEDDAFELFFTYSWGSGMHHSLIGYFDSKIKEDVSFDFVNDDSDMVLELDKDGALCVYRARSSGTSFIDMKMIAEDKVGEIIFQDGEIVLLEEPKRGES